MRRMQLPEREMRREVGKQMMIDRWGTHKNIKTEDLDAVLLAQVMTWLEESHFWETKEGSRKEVTCRWCGAYRNDYYCKLTDIPADKICVCPENPVIRGMHGDPSVHYTLSRIKS